MGKGGQRHAPATLPQGKSGRGCIGCHTGMDFCGGKKISYTHLGFNPGPSSPQRVSVLTTLSRPRNHTGLVQKEARQ